LRILADVNVSGHVCSGLAAAGHEVLQVRHVLDLRTPDEEVLAEARKRRAVLLSHDQDFGGLLAVSGASGPSWINLRVTHVDSRKLVAPILTVLEAASSAVDAQRECERTPRRSCTPGRDRPEARRRGPAS
jgi:predicted nuclease of predicted toxin-antitoxin system